MLAGYRGKLTYRPVTLDWVELQGWLRPFWNWHDQAYIVVHVHVQVHLFFVTVLHSKSFLVPDDDDVSNKSVESDYETVGVIGVSCGLCRSSMPDFQEREQAKSKYLNM